MIQILLPYENAGEKYHVWAHEEEKINFRKDLYSATRCTLSFAAEELCKYLTMLGFEADVSDVPREYKIYICCNDGYGESFSFVKSENTITICGNGRIGTLYGVYEFLEVQGIRWYSPWEEYIPNRPNELKIPESRKYFPSMPLGRGFDFEGPLKESKLLYLWMARNKLNLSTVRHNTKQFQRKLGMSFKVGGHIFEKILDPNQKMLSGKTMFTEHNDWYGKTEEALTPDNALARQFCVSNDEMKEYLWQNLLYRLNNEWYDADRVDIWGFDTWGNTCKCDNCIRLGNGADQMLHFISYLRNKIDEAILNNELDHNVSLVMCAYEGTATIEPPINGIPENLKNSGDYVVYYPIIRCYRHLMNDKDCSYNTYYQKLLEEWNGIPMMVGEYYNVSKFEDLPLVFENSIPKDLSGYYKNGISGMTYMHLPMSEWGVRTINQILYAKLCWDINCDVEDIKQKYFDDLYMEFSEEVKKAYSITQEALSYCTSWRAWCGRSVLSALLSWDGKADKEPLYRDDHLGDNLYEIGQKSVELLKESAKILEEIYGKSEILFAKGYVAKSGVPVNPTDTRFKGKKNYLTERIAQDLRGINYGIDVLKLMLYFVLYHEALRTENNADRIWEDIRVLSHKMMGYCYAVKYVNPEPEMNVVDALERSGLKDLYYRVLSNRTR